MTDNPKVLAVIPARGGSKRLPRKNVMMLNGHPMLAYSIMAAKKSKRLTDWLVSTEDDEVAEIASKYGAATPFKRPDHLAADNIRNIDVVLHALKFMEDKKNITYDIIVLLQPTAPVRDSAHIDKAVELLWASNLPTLAAVKGPYQKRDPILKRIDAEGRLVPYSSDPDLDPREPFYIYNATLYAVKRDYFLAEKSFVSNEQVPLVMDKFYSADVDDMGDFMVADAYLKYLNRDIES